jgi:hypothetical protein
MPANAFGEQPTVLVHPGAPTPPPAVAVLQVNFKLTDGPSGVLVPLFMGEEPARRFLTSLGDKGAGMTLFQVGGFDALETLLTELKKGGATHVNFNAERDRPNPIPIDDVLESLHNRPRQ